MENKYISVQEFADLVGVTTQGIYKKINSKKDKEFNKFVKDENGKKTISTAAAKLFEKSAKPTVEQQFSNCLETVEQQFNNRLNQIKEEYEKYIKLLEDKIADKEKIVAKQEEEISFLRSELAAKNNMLSDQVRLAENAQHLQLLAERKIAAIEDKKSKGWLRNLFKTEVPNE